MVPNISTIPTVYQLGSDSRKSSTALCGEKVLTLGKNTMLKIRKNHKYEHFHLFEGQSAIQFKTIFCLLFKI